MNTINTFKILLENNQKKFKFKKKKLNKLVLILKKPKYIMNRIKSKFFKNKKNKQKIYYKLKQKKTFKMEIKFKF